MKKLPSYLKGLVESRARSAGDIERLEHLRALIEEEIAAARRRQEAADILIREVDPLLEPSQIQPITPRKGRYGQVKAAILEVVREAAPRALPSSEIAFLVAEKTAVRFHSSADFRLWAKNTVNRQLRKQWEAGAIERLPVAGEEARWRDRSAAAPQSLQELSEVR